MLDKTTNQSVQFATQNVQQSKKCRLLVFRLKYFNIRIWPLLLKSMDFTEICIFCSFFRSFADLQCFFWWIVTWKPQNPQILAWKPQFLMKTVHFDGNHRFWQKKQFFIWKAQFLRGNLKFSVNFSTFQPKFVILAVFPGQNLRFLTWKLQILTWKLCFLMKNVFFLSENCGFHWKPHFSLRIQEDNIKNILI